MTYMEQRAWSDKFLPEVMEIVHRNHHLLPRPAMGATVCIADEMRDMKQATDAIITHTGEVCIAIRIRRFKYLPSYRNEFTIRIKSKHGGQSELEKIRAGFCSVYFYGFANDAEDGLAFWRILDVSKFRRWLRKIEKTVKRPFQTIDNRDGSMGAAFRVRDSLADCVIVDSTDKDSDQLPLF